jgi:two-component system cell cycle response regulator
LEELKARLRSGLRIVRLEEELRLRATRDVLTGVLTRRAILEALDAEIERARRSGRTMSVVMADVDHFKTINDAWGHLVGDAVLHETAQRLRRALRDYDGVGRYGGEEFLILVPESGPEAAREIADRLRKAVADLPVNVDGNRLSVTISVGLATGTVDDGADARTFLRLADRALYSAKHAGRNRIEVLRTTGA